MEWANQSSLPTEGIFFARFFLLTHVLNTNIPCLNFKSLNIQALSALHLTIVDTWLWLLAHTKNECFTIDIILANMPGFAQQFANVRCTQVWVMSVKRFSLYKHLIFKNLEIPLKIAWEKEVSWYKLLYANDVRKVVLYFAKLCSDKQWKLLWTTVKGQQKSNK